MWKGIRMGILVRTAYPGPPHAHTIQAEIRHRMHGRFFAAEVAIDKNGSQKADKTSKTSPEAPFTTIIQLDGKSIVPSTPKSVVRIWREMYISRYLRFSTSF